MRKAVLIISIISISLLSSCVSVEQYQKMYLNDADMELSQQKNEAYEGKVQMYREAASGATNGGSGGGCGCN